MTQPASEDDDAFDNVVDDSAAHVDALPNDLACKDEEDVTSALRLAMTPGIGPRLTVALRPPASCAACRAWDQN